MQRCAGSSTYSCQQAYRWTKPSTRLSWCATPCICGSNHALSVVARKAKERGRAATPMLEHPRERARAVASMNPSVAVSRASAMRFRRASANVRTASLRTSVNTADYGRLECPLLGWGQLLAPGVAVMGKDEVSPPQLDSALTAAPAPAPPCSEAFDVEMCKKYHRVLLKDGGGIQSTVDWQIPPAGSACRPFRTCASCHTSQLTSQCV